MPNRNGSWPLALAAGALGLAGLAGPGAAATGQPSPWQSSLQGPVTEVAEQVHWFHDFVNVVIVAIAAFVLILLAVVIVRFNEGRHPTPSRTTHNTVLEVAWTVIPIVILVALAIPSFQLLYLQYTFPKPDLTIKAIGNTWFWEHEYPDQGVKIASNMLRDEDVLKTELGKPEFDKRYKGLEGLPLIKRLYADAQPLWQKQKLVRQLSVDNDIAVPVNKVVHVLVTANDVIHAWTIPSFGVKVDAVPGRVTATWFKATKTGVYFGQCSELCGKDHANMPIAVRVVEEAVFNNWIAAVKARDLRRARGILHAATDDPVRARMAAGADDNMMRPAGTRRR